MIEKKARELFHRFRHEKSSEENIIAAMEMKSHFHDCQSKDVRDNVGAVLLDLLCPKKEVPKYGFNGRPIHDLTRGRPDTPEWIFFLKIVNRDNPYYYEYDNALRYMSYDLDWAKGIREELSKGKMEIVTHHAPTPEEALKKAKEQLSKDVTVVKVIESPPRREEKRIKALDEESAKELIEDDLHPLDKLESIEIKKEGKKGFLGKKARPNTYIAYITRDASAAIIYREKQSEQNE